MKANDLEYTSDKSELNDTWPPPLLSILFDAHIAAVNLTFDFCNLVQNGSFAWRLRRTIGAEIHRQIMIEGLSDDVLEKLPIRQNKKIKVKKSPAQLSPVRTLFYWVTLFGGLKPEMLASEDGSYIDDTGEALPPEVKPSYSHAEQLAVYGSWLLDNEFDGCGILPEKSEWERADLCASRTKCVIQAYQAFSYSQRIMLGDALSAKEIEEASHIDFARLGKAGAAKRHAPMAELKAWTLQRYSEGKWPSPPQAAYDLKESVIKHGKTINAHLIESNAQTTITNWIREYSKGKNIPV